MRIRKNKKVVNLTESDLRRIVKRVISEQRKNDTEVNRHRYRDGSNPGIEDLLDFYCRSCEMDPRASGVLTNDGRKLQDRLIYQLNNDIYANPENPTNFGRGTRRGKLRIVFNGREMKVEQFVDQIQRDFEDGYCHKIRNYEYNNRVLGRTKIMINTETRECKKSIEPSPSPVNRKEISYYGKICPKPNSGWYERVIEMGMDRSRRFNWDRVIPKMGVSKEAVCKCFKENLDSLDSRIVSDYKHIVGFCKPKDNLYYGDDEKRGW